MIFFLRPNLSFYKHIYVMSFIKPKVVFVLGGPGSGKGTQCNKLMSRFGFKHLSAGDLLREERNNPNSEFGELIEHHIENGTIVPVEITCKLIERAMQQSNNNLFLIDGFPRNKDNLEGWLREMKDKVDLQFVLFLECPLDICIDRCLARGAAGSGRTDDNIESLKKRITTFNEDTLPIVNHYKNQNLVKSIDSSKSLDEVFEEVVKYFENIKN